MNDQAPPPNAMGVKYGAGSGETVNIYSGQHRNSTTVLVYHGGGWKIPESLAKQCKELQAAGFCVMEVRYTEAVEGGQAGFPIQVEEVEESYNWAVENAATYFGSTTKIVLLGASSGGQIAWTGALKLGAGATALKAVITLSAAGYELIELLETGKGTTWTKDLPIALGTTTQELALTEPYKKLAQEMSAEPILTGANRPAKCLVYNSANEIVPIAQQEAMVPALEAAGCVVTANTRAGSQHATAYWDAVKEEIYAYIEVI